MVMKLDKMQILQARPRPCLAKKFCDINANACYSFRLKICT